jgi:hypothetical protein
MFLLFIFNRLGGKPAPSHEEARFGEQPTERRAVGRIASTLSKDRKVN